MMSFLWLMMSLFAVGVMPHILRHKRNVDPDEQSCVCIPSHLCADKDVDGQGLLDIRLQDEACSNYFEVCCNNPIEVINLPDQQIFRGCGYQNSGSVAARVTSSSQNALFGELPWSLVILVRDFAKTERNMYQCGGSLIHPQVAVTAAHCVSGIEPKHFTVRAGEWDTKSRDEPFAHQDRTVQEIVSHPYYHNGSLRNDIALLFLGEPFVFADNIGLICLPPPSFQLEDPVCIASGWGKDTFETGKHSSILKKVELPLVPRKKCASALRKTRLGTMYNLHQSFICAGGEKNKDTCKGDGGSPLICPIAGEVGRFFQIGIVSWGIGCGESETPGVYVNVPLYTKWIDEQLASRNLDTTLYKY